MTTCSAPKPFVGWDGEPYGAHEIAQNLGGACPYCGVAFEFPGTKKRYIEERIYYPDGMDPIADAYESSSFAVRVEWRGKEWAVVRGLGHPSHEFLTRTGKWLYLPMPMHRRWCRFDFETACRLAEENVNNVRVNMRTWAEWQAHWKKEGA